MVDGLEPFFSLWLGRAFIAVAVLYLVLSLGTAMRRMIDGPLKSRGEHET